MASGVAFVCRLKTIDGFGLFFNAEELHVSRRKSQALLTYLWLKDSHTETRSRLSTLLWSRSGDSEARVSLRQELSRVNKELLTNSSYLSLSGDKFAIWLARSPPLSDADAIIAELEAGRVPAILLEVSLIHEQYLASLQGIDPEFDMWISVQRAAFSRRCSRALSAIAAQAKGTVQARDAARALFNIDPSDESACRQLMEAAIAESNVPEAIRLFNELRQLLLANYGVKPSKDLSDFAEGLSRPRNESSEAASPPAGRPPVRPSDGRILLLIHPVESALAGDDAIRRFAVLRNELIGALARFRDWSVREFGVGDDHLAATATADKVYQIALSGENVGNTDFLTVNLLSTASKTCLWSESLEVDYLRFIGQKRETIRKIAFALNIEISAHRLSAITGKPPTELDIYDKWLLGQSLLFGWRPKDEAQAEAIFRSILAQSGTFAPAISSLVQVLNTRHHIFPGVMRNRDREAEALELARRAAQLAPHDCRTQLTLGWSYLMNDLFEQASYYFEMAVDINDNDPGTLISAAQGLCYAGEKASALDLATRATTVGRGGGPMHWAYVACIEFHAGNDRQALRAIERSDDVAYFSAGMRAAIVAQSGDEIAARAAASAFEKRIKDAWFGKEPPTQRNIRKWFCQIFPIRMLADRERLEKALDRAGFGLS